MSEVSYYRFTNLHPELANQLLTHKITPDLAAQMEEKVGAYFDYDADIFGGILYHPVRKGPENPFFRPITERDWLPAVQAIACIGIQYYYWDCVYQGVNNRSLDPSRLFSTNQLIFYSDADGNISIEIGIQPDRVNLTAQNRGDSVARFPAFILLSNYGGDGDFYGIDENQIFPMRVKSAEGIWKYVERSQLGLSEENAENAWNSWRKFMQLNSELYHKAFILFLGQNQLSPKIIKILQDAAKSGEIYFSSGAIARTLIERGIRNKSEITSIMKFIESSLRSRFSEEDILLLISASCDHSNNLKLMYDTARAFRADLYDYE